jgi:hypothetical protein
MDKFLVPVYHNGKIYTHGELIKPRGGVLADAEKAPNEMTGIVRLVSGCLKSVTSPDGEIITDKTQIEGIVRHMPFQSAEYLAKLVFVRRSDGSIEQIVHCPRCNDKYIYEFISDEEGMDNRIKFDDLQAIEYEKNEKPSITIELEEPVEIKTKKGDILFNIENLTLDFPNMNNGISGSMKYPNDNVRAQYMMYVSALTHINLEEIDHKFRSTWGMFLFDRMSLDDIEKIAEELKQYGLQKNLERTCSKCDKTFKFVVETNRFFD